MNRKPINIHKQTQIMAHLSAMIGVLNVRHKANGGVGEAIDEAKAMKAAARRYARHTGTTSKYGPHQGDQECTRRRRQMEAGQI